MFLALTGHPAEASDADADADIDQTTDASEMLNEEDAA